MRVRVLNVDVFTPRAASAKGVGRPAFAYGLAEMAASSETSAFGSDSDIVLTISEPGTLTPPVGLIRNGDFLRFFLVPDGGQETDISVRIRGFADPVSTVPHTIAMSWGKGIMSISLDG